MNVRTAAKKQIFYAQAVERVEAMIEKLSSELVGDPVLVGQTQEMNGEGSEMRRSEDEYMAEVSEKDRNGDGWEEGEGGVAMNE